MVSDRMKQRLVGVAVLVALAVIFVPVLFNLQPSQPLDTTSQIPPAPDIDPVAFEEPEVPAVDNEVPPHDEVFAVEAPASPAQADNEEQNANGGGESVEDEPVASEPLPSRETPEETVAEMAAAPETAPTLAESGLPEAWVIQVGSYSRADSAAGQVARLKEAGFKAYAQRAEAAGKIVHRVLVGPFVSRKTAESDKRQVDAALGVKSLILSYEP